MHETCPSYIKSDYLSLWLGRIIAADIAADPSGQILTAAKERLNLFLRPMHPYSKPYFDRWEATIDAGPEAVMALLCDTSEEAQPLRSSSPFIMDQAVRSQAIEAFKIWWQSQETSSDFLVASQERHELSDGWAYGDDIVFEHWGRCPGYDALLDRAESLYRDHEWITGHRHVVTARAKNARIDFDWSMYDPTPHGPTCDDLWQDLSSVEEVSQVTCERCGAGGEERADHEYHTLCLACASIWRVEREAEIARATSPDGQTERQAVLQSLAAALAKRRGDETSS